MSAGRRREAWEQQPGETPAAYRAFTVYRDLGDGRSLLAAYRLRYGRETAINLPGYITAWSSKYAWPDRARAYDEHRQRLELAEKERVWAARAAQVADLQWDASQRLLERAEQMLEHPLTTTTTSEDGKTTTVRPAKWTAADIRTYFEAGLKLAALSTGKATDRQEITGADGAPLLDAGIDLTGLSDEQLAQLRALLAAARAARGRSGD